LRITSPMLKETSASVLFYLSQNIVRSIKSERISRVLLCLSFVQTNKKSVTQ
jgi:hypothetical protein